MALNFDPCKIFRGYLRFRTMLAHSAASLPACRSFFGKITNTPQFSLLVSLQYSFFFEKKEFAAFYECLIGGIFGGLRFTNNNHRLACRGYLVNVFVIAI